MKGWQDWDRATGRGEIGLAILAWILVIGGMTLMTLGIIAVIGWIVAVLG